MLLEAADLTNHGVIVGMTGSGKTGLGVVLLEEALLAGIPTIAIDPEGDLGNLLLTFPELRPGVFAPWVEGGDPRARVEHRAHGVGEGAEAVDADHRRAAGHQAALVAAGPPVGFGDRGVELIAASHARWTAVSTSSASAGRSTPGA